MPQIILEYSANIPEINFQEMYQDIYTFMKTIPDIGTCKIRSISQKNYFIGSDNGENAFAFLRILMAPKRERNDQFCENIIDAMAVILERHIKLSTQGSHIYCKPTVEVGFLSKHYRWID